MNHPCPRPTYPQPSRLNPQLGLTPPLELSLHIPPHPHPWTQFPPVQLGASTAPLPSHPQPLLAPRPNLKRSVPTCSSSAPLSLACSPPAPHAGANNPLHLRTRSSSSSLDPIAEWPLAETDSSATTASSAGLGLSGIDDRYPRLREEEQDRPRVKRARLAPDHEALARLSLASPLVAAPTYVQLPATPLVSSFSPPVSPPVSPPCPAPLPSLHLDIYTANPLQPPHPPSSPSASTYPAAPPTSPVTTAHSRTALSSAHPTSTNRHGGLPETPQFPSPFFSPTLSPPPSAAAAAAHCTSAPLPVDVSGLLDGPPPPPITLPAQPREKRWHKEDEDGEEEVEMRPAKGSWDLDPHRIYVASLSDDDEHDDDDDDDDASTTAVQVNSLALKRHHPPHHKRGGSLPSPLPTSVLSCLWADPSATGPGSGSAAAGSLILYRPPPRPAFPGALGSAESPIPRGGQGPGGGGGRGGGEGETARERALREKKEERRELEFEEFRRRQERVEGGEAEADRDKDWDQGGERGEEEDGMEVEMDMEMEMDG
ncbi:hypothetical protein JCM11641_000611 [Rhodosporidiobolus odoratus]